jgi:hypothetical protein
VPAFLDDEFTRQLGGANVDMLQAWYRSLNAQVLAAGTPIGDALKWLRARFAAWVGTRPGARRPPHRLRFGPLSREVARRAPRHAHLAPPPNRLTAAFARVVHEGCRHTPECGDHRTCAWKLVQQADRDDDQEARP